MLILLPRRSIEYILPKIAVTFGENILYWKPIPYVYFTWRLLNVYCISFYIGREAHIFKRNAQRFMQ